MGNGPHFPRSHLLTDATGAEVQEPETHTDNDESGGEISAHGVAVERLTSPQRVRERQLLASLANLERGSADWSSTRDELVTLYLPLVHHLARPFRGRGEPFDDVLQVGTIGLIKAIDGFNVDLGFELSTYATPTILGEIRRHFRDRGWAVRVPRRIQELRQLLVSATDEISQRTGRSPSVAELAAHLGISSEEVVEGLEGSQAYRASSLDAPANFGDEGSTIGDMLGEVESAFENIEYRESLKPLLASLPARERRMLLLRYFHNMTQSQIADEVGVSQMQVSRLLNQTLATLREGLESG